MALPARMPQATQSDEPGWWLAVDGRWYPPESSPTARATAAKPVRVHTYSEGNGEGQAIVAIVVACLAIVMPFTLLRVVGYIGAGIFEVALAFTAFGLSISALRRGAGALGLAAVVVSSMIFVYALFVAAGLLMYFTRI